MLRCVVLGVCSHPWCRRRGRPRQWRPTARRAPAARPPGAARRCAPWRSWRVRSCSGRRCRGRRTPTRTPRSSPAPGSSRGSPRPVPWWLREEVAAVSENEQSKATANRLKLLPSIFGLATTLKSSGVCLSRKASRSTAAKLKTPPTVPSARAAASSATAPPGALASAVDTATCTPAARHLHTNTTFRDFILLL